MEKQTDLFNKSKDKTLFVNKDMTMNDIVNLFKSMRFEAYRGTINSNLLEINSLWSETEIKIKKTQSLISTFLDRWFFAKKIKYLGSVDAVEYVMPLISKTEKDNNCINSNVECLIIIQTINWRNFYSGDNDYELFEKNFPFELFFKIKLKDLEYEWIPLYKNYIMKQTDETFFTQCSYTSFIDNKTYLKLPKYMNIYNTSIKEMLRYLVYNFSINFKNSKLDCSNIDFLKLSLLPQTIESVKNLGFYLDKNLIDKLNINLYSGKDLFNEEEVNNGKSCFNNKW